jgi:hypothetical protein
MFNYTVVKNPRWINQEHTKLECEVNFEHLPEEFVLFSAVPEGDYPHSHDIFERCASGEFGPVAEYIAPPVQEYAPVIEPIPVVDVSPTTSEPTRAELKAQLDALQAQVADLLANQSGT